ncbi:MAG: hypothetical protein WC933_03650 [Candidatus Paceibacterota bacterium]|jgi:hypothetical protein
MFENLTPLHSYDPFAILRLIYNLIFGGAKGATDWGSRAHDSWIAFWSAVPYYLINGFAKYAVAAFFLSLALLILLVVYVIREKEIREKLMSRVLPADGEVETESGDSVMENPKWVLITEHINSEDANKWKLAILESDIILSELLESLNLSGEGVGEKLKSVEESDFKTIESAWEAHKIRNAIAHQGSDFLLTKREAKRIIGLYESVFEEFEII